MRHLHLICFFISCAFAAELPLNETLLDGCTIKRYEDVDSVVKNCKTISVGSFAVPAGKTLQLHLQYGTYLTFNGNIAFAYTEWTGPLIWIAGDGITVDGSSSHLINARGELWWDGHGGHNNKKKPRVMAIHSSNSVFKNIKVKNCPETCIGIGDSHDTVFENWTIDSRDGDKKGGVNTDGFDVGRSYRITIKDSSVWNQDDCICVNGGQHLLFQNMDCVGGHGLSIASGIFSTYADNTVHNVTFKNSVIQNSFTAIHLKTIPDNNKKGEISDITYDNIKLVGIQGYSIIIQEDYTNDGPTGHPLGNIPIKNFNLHNVYGTMSGKNSVKAYILCGPGGCSNWNWSNINISGAAKPNSCNYTPNGFIC